MGRKTAIVTELAALQINADVAGGSEMALISLAIPLCLLLGVYDSGVRHPLLDGRHSAFCQDYQILCTLFPMLPDLPTGHAVMPISRGILCWKLINRHSLHWTLSI